MASMDEASARQRFAAARVASLSTVDVQGRPHIVPVTFVVAGARIWSATDGKAKRRSDLRRHANIRAHPRVSLLVQHWDEDWSALWWVRADGNGTLVEAPATLARVGALLRHKYPQYRQITLGPPVIEVVVDHWRWWHGVPVGFGEPRGQA
jgi:PPOX class probable F420-dependent enzyme